jgi:hypothetical protein
MSRKVILPSEVKVCATCTYWDGEREVDEEVHVVVVAADCSGECVVQEKHKQALHDVRLEDDCLWDDLEPDRQVEVEEPPRADKKQA